MMDRVFAFVLGVEMSLVLAGIAVAVVDRGRNDEWARSEAQWCELVEASYQNGYQCGLAIGRQATRPAIVHAAIQETVDAR